MNLTHIIELFPIPVMFSHYATGISDAELQFARSLPLIRNLGNRRSADSYVLSLPEFGAIRTFCLETLQEYIDSVCQPKHPLTPVLTQSWINIATKGEFHPQHHHPNSFLSGIMYFSTNQDSITFLQPERKLFSIPPAVSNNHNSEECLFKPDANELIVFPSYLFHLVDVKQSEGERISLAFNSVIKGQLGNEAALTELIL